MYKAELISSVTWIWFEIFQTEARLAICCCIEETLRGQRAGSVPSRQVHHYRKCHRRAENRACMEIPSEWQGSDRPSIHASRALTKSLFTTFLSMSVANILSLVFTTFGTLCLQELLRDWKAMPSRKTVPNIFLQWATSLSPLSPVRLDFFLFAKGSLSVSVQELQMFISWSIAKYFFRNKERDRCLLMPACILN